MKRSTLQTLLDARAQRQARVLVTDLTSGAERLLDPDRVDVEPAALRAAVGRAATRDRGELIDLPGGVTLLRVYNPPLRMLIIGAVHIAQSLVAFAGAHGFDVTLIDPRRAFATPERFPGVRMLHAWPERALAELQVDRRCALVTLTHDPKLDDPALCVALEKSAFYVGALGSRRSHQARLQRLTELGVAPAQLERIHGPVGLAIGAVGAAEIATSIMAQVISTLRRGPQ